MRPMCSCLSVWSKPLLLAFLFLAAFLIASSVAFGQNSFMLGFSNSGFGADIVNRGDFNNDGIPDVITGNNGDYGVSVNLGKGDGRFQAAKNSAPGVGTFDMTIGDFNGDGKLDVALVGYTNGTNGLLQIMLGNGDGTFTKGQTVSFASIPGSVTSADFDNDGKLDLAVGMDKVYFYKGAGDGTFSAAGSFSLGTPNSVGVRVGDFNADGKVDLAANDGLNLFVLWNNGGFKFSKVLLKSTKYGIGATPVDVNQDHFTDLLVTYYTCEIGKDVSGYGCTNWEVLLGSGKKTFRKSAEVNIPGYSNGLWGTTAADVNGDGINDIVGLGNFFQMMVWLGNPDGSYQNTPLVFQVGSNTSASDLVAGDFNRDGKIDFAIPAPGQSNSIGLAVFLNATPRAACTPSTVSPSVTVCEPQDLIYSNSPVHWIADSRDTAHSVTGMQIYVDHKLVVNSPSSSLNESLTLAKGPHFVSTKAWDSSGANFQSDRNITVYSGARGETCPAAESSLNLCLPTQNETTSTSLHVFANSDSAAQITAVQVYIDSRLIYNDTSGSTYVDTAFTVTPGTHAITVKAFDADGNSFSEARNITAQ
jgi:hypothetical protein